MSKATPEVEKSTAEESDERQPDVVYRHRPDQIVDHKVEKQQISFFSETNIRLRLTVHTPEIFQLKYIVEGDLTSDFSYAIDPDFTSETVDIQLQEKESYFEVTTPALVCRITKKNMQVQFLDQEGNLLCKDEESFFRRESLMKGIAEVKVTHHAPDGASYFGLGDKPCDLDLRGKSFQNWNTDSYAYERGDDPLYRTIPFYATLHKERAYGIFMDNPYRSYFDFDSEDDNTTTFSAEGGCMNYYFIYGPELTSVSQQYTRLTGTPELPPLWGLGYHQCRWSYFPEARVKKLAQDFREKEFPCDAIYLDIDYMDDYRVFTWNSERFPDPARLISELEEQGFETIVMVDPGIKMDSDYPVYREGREKDCFCKRPDGDMLIAPVWPPKTVFPDYTKPEVRHWWADLHKDLIANKKVSGVWNDMNEPAVFEVKKKTFPEDIRHHFDGHPASHKKAHNIYGMQMARASHQGIKKHNEGKRPFLLTRANFSGGQRYAALWTGDNIATWDHLKLANEQCQRLSISGFSFVGSDLGGFVKDPTPELFTRWLQLGIFHPLFRNHTMGYNVDGAAAVKEDQVELKKKMTTSDQEPWTFGDKYTDINRSIIELRYRLLHYLYTAFRKYITEGTPILRPLAFYDQKDAKAAAHNDEFLFGEKILVSPVLDKSKRSVETYFPEGSWYDFRTNDLFEGQSTHTVDAPLAEIPFFVKAGTVLPLREVMQYTQERDPELMELNVYYSDSKVTSHLYEDAEEGYDYTDGDYRSTIFTLQGDAETETLTLTADREGSFYPEYDEIKINIIGLPFEPSSVNIDGDEIQFYKKESTQQPVYSLRTNPDFKKLTVR